MGAAYGDIYGTGAVLFVVLRRSGCGDKQGGSRQQNIHQGFYMFYSHTTMHHPAARLTVSITASETGDSSRISVIII
jgi:hypothetical protein